MYRIVKFSSLLLIIFFLFSNSGGAQERISLPRSLREKQRKAMRLRDSMLRSFNKSDTSINSLLQRIQQYTTTYNQINNNLAEGLDTADVSESLPAAIKRINKIDSLTNTHKSSTLRYLFVLRDNLDHIQGELTDWQADLEDINSILIQNQTDLVKLSKDTLLKARTNDSLLKKTFFVQRKALFLLWRSTDAVNRRDLAKINYLQDKIAISYTNLLDETDHIDSKIRKFADRAFAGEFDYIWDTDHQYDDFQYALNSTLKVNKTLFNYFIKSETLTHLTALFFLVIVFIWVMFNRRKITGDNENFETLAARAKYIYKRPVVASLLVGMAIIPYFYSHPPVVFTEILFLFPMLFVLFFVRKEFPKTLFNFLLGLFLLTLLYGVSNLFIEISNADMFMILGLSIVSILLGLFFLQKLKQAPGEHLPYTDVILKVFIAMQSLSLVLDITGRFSLAKIIGVTAVFNLWMLLVLYFVVEIISEALYLQFQSKKDHTSLLDWVDYTIVEVKFKKILFLLASFIWLFFLAQNLNIDDAARDYLADVLSTSRTVGGASFTFEGFVIFIAVIWLSSIISKIISYFYDVSALRADDLSVLKKKNRTSTLLIRLGVFAIGFMLAVAASNFPLDKITIIISAFGIGIGFGLQNIVNNLVSGLILAFEKPVQIGDIIEIDSRSGTIKEIGIRASRIATADGAEVIIPNGDLIAHHVINWTLSNNNRRIELIIGVAYGSDIDKVKGVLKDLLSGRDDIMGSPAPSVFLHNLNESSVDFRMFFWAADISTWLELKSRVLADIYSRFAQEGIDIPFPTRDLHVHMDTKDDKKDDPATNQPLKEINKDEPTAGLEDVKS